MRSRQTPMLILALDRAGNPSSWVSQETAIHLMATDRVLAPISSIPSFYYPKYLKYTKHFFIYTLLI